MTIEHLTQRELAARWRVSTKALERWRWLKTGPSYMRLGGRVVYRLEDVEDYERRQLRQTQQNAILGTWR